MAICQSWEKNIIQSRVIAPTNCQSPWRQQSHSMFGRWRTVALAPGNSIRASAWGREYHQDVCGGRMWVVCGVVHRRSALAVRALYLHDAHTVTRALDERVWWCPKMGEARVDLQARRRDQREVAVRIHRNRTVRTNSHTLMAASPVRGCRSEFVRSRVADSLY